MGALSFTELHYKFSVASVIVLDDSKVDGGRRFKGLEIELHRSSGVRVLRVVHPHAQGIDEHRHEWSYIGIHTAGEYLERYDGGEALMAGPSAVLHPAGRPHADTIGSRGLETLTIEFDPAWLKHHGFDRRLDRSHLWSGGAAAHAARQLGRTLRNAPDETAIGAATSRFLHAAMQADRPLALAWIPQVKNALQAEAYTTLNLARRFDLHPAYLARAYRQATGEGLHETLRRARVERASSLLRNSDAPLAEVAIAAGFCDQSHMNRCFAAVLGRTPVRIRAERQLFEQQVAII